MYETVTVDQAIAKAQRTINMPTILLLVVPIAGSAFLISKHLIPGWVFGISLVLGIGLAWLYWGIKITKWRVWAFENVRNVHELKKRAVREKLIWPDGSFWNKTEIWSAIDREKWLSLQSKFNQDDVFTDDLSIPSETIIYFSKSKNYFEMAIMLVILGGGIYFLAAGNYIVAVVAILIGGYGTYKEYKQATNTNPQIILSDKGIQTATAPFYEWKDVFNEDSIGRSAGKTTNYYLVYDCPDGHIQLQIDDLETDQKKLYNLLAVYRGRYQKKTSRH